MIEKPLIQLTAYKVLKERGLVKCAGQDFFLAFNVTPEFKHLMQLRSWIGELARIDPFEQQHELPHRRLSISIASYRDAVLFMCPRFKLWSFAGLGRLSPAVMKDHKKVVTRPDAFVDQ